MNPFEHHQLSRMERKLDALLRGEAYIFEEIQDMIADLTNITREVTETTDAQAAAVLLLNDLSDRLDAAGTDPVKLKELSDALSASTDSLAAAVVANTRNMTNSPNDPNSPNYDANRRDPNHPNYDPNYANRSAPGYDTGAEQPNPGPFPAVDPGPGPTGGVTATYNGPESGVDVAGQRFDVNVPVSLANADVIAAVRADGNFTVADEPGAAKALSEAIAADVPHPQDPHISPT